MSNRQILPDAIVKVLRLRGRIRASDGSTLIDGAAKTFTGDSTGVHTGTVKGELQTITGDGAITIKHGVVRLTKGSAAAITLAAPTAGTDDGKQLWIISNTAFVHTVTIANGLKGAGVSADVGTFTAAVDNGFGLYADNGAWWPLPGTNVNVTWA